MTYVAVEEGDVLGYLTVAHGGIEIDDLPAALRTGLPRYPLPVLRLARFAVDSRVRARRLCEQLLRFALGLALTMAEDYGCVGVAVDAKPGAGAFYARYGFRAIEVVEGLSDARPRPTPMFLPTTPSSPRLRPWRLPRGSRGASSCLACEKRVPTRGRRRCPLCGQVFRSGWEGVETDWRMKHAAVLAYERFRSSLCRDHRAPRAADCPSCRKSIPRLQPDFEKSID